LKQGDCLGTTAVHWHNGICVEESTGDRNATLHCELIQIVGYADDICIMGRTKEAMKRTCKELKRAAKEVGISFNINKTKIMAHSSCDTHIGQEVKIGGDTIEVLDEFVYLGTCITKHIGELVDIRRRIGLANKAYHSLLAII
jgi:hypothetical protein